MGKTYLDNWWVAVQDWYCHRVYLRALDGGDIYGKEARRFTKKVALKAHTYIEEEEHLVASSLKDETVVA